MMRGDMLKGIHNRKTLTLASVMGSLLLAGCGGSSSGGGGGGVDVCADTEFDCQAMLTNLNDNIMVPSVQDFQTQATKLEDKAEAYSTTLSEGGDMAAAETELQEAWDDAMLSWQSIEVMQVGPLKDNSGALRDNIYSWPSTDSCNVDEDVILATDDQNYDITSRAVTRRGLDALEYVAYSTGDLTLSCSDDQVTGNSTLQQWTNLSDAEKRQYRATYAEKAAVALSDRADELVSKWTGSNGFEQELTNPDSNGSRFANQLEAVNAVTDSLFYIEDEVKDIKLAVPLCGDKLDCPDDGQVTPEEVENPFSERSKEHVRQNLVTFQTLFLGNKEGESPTRSGLDDLLDAVNEENISSMMETDTQETLDDLNGIGEGVTLTQALQPGNTTGEDAVRDVWESAQDITDRLKNDFLTTLSLSIPGSAAGDGD